MSRTFSRSIALVFSLAAMATLSIGASAQMTDPAGQGNGNNQPAPITRSAPMNNQNNQMSRVKSSQPVQGVWVRSDANGTVTTTAKGVNGTEIHVEHGRANVQVAHPADGSEIMVDLPGGQVALIKDGFYTFNAETNTVRVLHGEADAYVGANTAGKPVKVKEDHQLVLTAGMKAKGVDDPRQLTADLLETGPMRGGNGGAYGERGPGYGYYGGYAPAYAYGPYGDYPVYGYEYPYYAYPYGYGFGYPFGFGIGFGYYGGFGGFRGGFRR